MTRGTENEVAGQPSSTESESDFDNQNTEGDEDDLTREYFRRFLRQKFADWKEDRIEEKVNRALGVEEIRQTLDRMRRLEEKIRKEDPDWKGGWEGGGDVS